MDLLGIEFDPLKGLNAFTKDVFSTFIFSSGK